MLPLRMRSGSSGGAVRSTISIAGEMPAIAALAVSWSAPAGTSRPMWTAISGSATGLTQPASDTLPPDATRALRVRNPTNGPVMLRRLSIAGAAKPTFQPNGASPAARRLRRSSSCARMPRTTRASSQRFMTPLRHPAKRDIETSMAVRSHLVAGGLDRAGTHPAPHQHDILVRGVVEAVPALARRVDDVAFARWGLAIVGIDMAVALEHDEELVAIVMAVPLVARPRLEHGPTDHMVGAGGGLVDQELHLHVDPAVLAFEARDLRHVAHTGAIHFRGLSCRARAADLSFALSHGSLHGSCASTSVAVQKSASFLHRVRNADF